MLEKVSIVIPTLNAGSVLEPCLKSISIQDYPKSKIEIIVADGGSTDNTLELAKKYGAKVVSNPLKTGESGKAVGVRKATGKFIALVDSDNILPNRKWLKQMVGPLEKHPEAVGSEPWKYTWRKEDGFITRYCALIGMNDPFVHFVGNYDRFNLITGKWTEVPRKEENFKDYILVGLDKRGVPTIGANGTVFRSSYLKKELKSDYLFDIDILAQTIFEKGEVKFIKVKNGIIHTYCERDIRKFAKKQRRRVRDFLFHKFVEKDRSFKWESEGPSGMIKFILSCVLVFPLVIDALRGFSKKKDPAWFFHILACEITLWEYGVGTIASLFKNRELDRKNWSQ